MDGRKPYGETIKPFFSLYTLTLYFPFKIHKPNNFGCPIISSLHSVIEHVSAFVDSHLQPIVQSLPSYIKDMKHFLTILCSFPILLPSNILLTTRDFTSL